MLILGIDSSAEEIAVAIVDDCTELAAVRTGSLRSSEMLVELVVDCCNAAFRTGNRASGALNRIERIAVARGPGSYTGLRTGLGTAFGLSKSLSIPITGISVLAARICSCNPLPGSCEVTLKAAPGEEFFQEYQIEHSHGVRKFVATSQLALRSEVTATGNTYPVDLPCITGFNPATAVALAANLALSDLLLAGTDVEHTGAGENGGITALYGKQVNAKTLAERKSS